MHAGLFQVQPCVQLIIDCPGQIELYTHIPILPRLAKLLTANLNINLVACYLLESQFMEDTAKYFSGVLSAMSCMIGLEVPFVNVMSKMDLVRKEGKRKKEVDRSVSSSFFSRFIGASLQQQCLRIVDSCRIALAGSWTRILNCCGPRPPPS